MTTQAFTIRNVSADAFARMEAIDKAYSDMTEAVQANIPDGPHRVLAVTSLEQCYLWCVRACFNTEDK